MFVAKIVCERGLESLMLDCHRLDVQGQAFSLVRAKLFERLRILQCADEMKIHHAAAFRQFSIIHLEDKILILRSAGNATRAINLPADNSGLVVVKFFNAG